MDTTVIEAGAEIAQGATEQLSGTAWGAVLVLFFVMLAACGLFFGYGSWRVVGWVGGKVDAWVTPLVARFMAFLDAMEETLRGIQATLDRLVMGQQQHGKELVQVHQRLDGIDESIDDLRTELRRGKETGKQ